MKSPLLASTILAAFLSALTVGAQTPANSAAQPPSTAARAPRVHEAKVTVLSTMLTDSLGVGEWGFSALVEIDGRRLLFDTGGRPDTRIHLPNGDLTIINAPVWGFGGPLIPTVVYAPKCP